MPRTFDPPWTIRDTGSCFIVSDANGQTLSYVYYDEPRAVGTNMTQLTFDEARRIAANIAKLPGLLGKD